MGGVCLLRSVIALGGLVAEKRLVAAETRSTDDHDDDNVAVVFSAMGGSYSDETLLVDHRFVDPMLRQRLPYELYGMTGTIH